MINNASRITFHYSYCGDIADFWVVCESYLPVIKCNEGNSEHGPYELCSTAADILALTVDYIAACTCNPSNSVAPDSQMEHNA